MSCERHCWHAFKPFGTGACFCCRDGCKDVLLLEPGVEIEEKTHGLIFRGGHPRVHLPRRSTPR